MSQSPIMKRHRAGTEANNNVMAEAMAGDAAHLYSRVLERMAARMSLFSFRGFLEPLRAIHASPGVLTLVAPSAFARDWARDHYASELGKEASLICGETTIVNVLFDEAPPRPETAAARTEKVREELARQSETRQESLHAARVRQEAAAQAAEVERAERARAQHDRWAQPELSATMSMTPAPAAPARRAAAKAATPPAATAPAATPLTAPKAAAPKAAAPKATAPKATAPKAAAPKAASKTRAAAPRAPTELHAAPAPMGVSAAALAASHARDHERSAPVVALRPRAVPGDGRARSVDRINPRYTFDSFVAGTSNRIALASCKSVAEEPAARFTPLFLFGPTGLGKTHLLHAIGNEIRAQHPHLRVVYVSAEQWVNEYIHDIREKKFDEFRRRYREGCDVLLLDDVQFLAGKEGSQEEFFHTFNALHEANKQVVVTSDRYPHEIMGLEDRLKTRLQWGLVADLKTPDLEMRLTLLSEKARQHRVDLPSDVADYLATHSSSSVRELEGALLRLQAFSSITREPMSVAQAREHLGPVLAAHAAPITMTRITEVVATYYGLKPAEVRSPCRQRQIARARQVAMYLIRMNLKASLPEIGRAFGGRDHTTVLASVRKIEGLKGTDASMQASLARLSQSLFGL